MIYSLTILFVLAVVLALVVAFLVKWSLRPPRAKRDKPSGDAPGSGTSPMPPPTQGH